MNANRSAAEVNEAMLGVPAYADDSLFFMLRYGEKAKSTLRKCEWDNFVAKMREMNVYDRRMNKAKTPTSSTSASAATSTDTSATMSTTVSLSATTTPESLAGTVSSGDVEAEAVASRAKAVQLREEALDIIRAFPELVEEFDKFIACSRAAHSGMGK